MLLALAWRNLSRYKARTAMTIFAVFLSVAVSVSVDGFMRGIGSLSEINLVTFESSEVIIFPSGAYERRDELPMDILIEEGTKEETLKLLSDNGIAASTRVKTLSDLISYDEEGNEWSLSVILTGIDREADAKVYDLPSSIIEGRWLEDGDEGIVLSEPIARKLGLETGSLVTVECAGREGFRETFDAEVQGIYLTDNTRLNLTTCYMSLPLLDGLLALSGAVSEISVSDSKVSIAAPSFCSEVGNIIKSVPGVEAHDWRETHEDLVTIANGDKGSSYLILFFLFIMAAAGIMNTMLMAVMERRRECAMLRAVGFSQHMINALFVLEGLICGVAGSVLGIIVAAAVTYPLARYGFDVSGLVPPDFDMGYRVALVLRSGWFLSSFVIIPLIAVALTAVSSYIPVRRAGKREIAELLRKE